ncbi:MAG: nitroreductase family deazaflavin-dependent oxidoreductase [Acidimicrobiia bacterium]|nr:nitroreductase family deazaflavin-dependent oxidoreductase [Acidimicrobiia bacterium]
MAGFNEQIIEEFRANGGKVGGFFAGSNLLLLHTIGAKSGEPRLHPLVYQPLGESYAIFGSKAGADSHPAWYHNLLANPRCRIEVGSETIDVLARVASDDERQPIWERQKQIAPGFADYESKTDRQIPVVILDPA